MLEVRAVAGHENELVPQDDRRDPQVGFGNGSPLLFKEGAGLSIEPGGYSPR